MTSFAYRLIVADRKPIRHIGSASVTPTPTTPFPMRIHERAPFRKQGFHIFILGSSNGRQHVSMCPPWNQSRHRAIKTLTLFRIQFLFCRAFRKLFPSFFQHAQLNV
jgi:hypothetical protein